MTGIRQLFEEAVNQQRLFADYDVCVMTAEQAYQFQGGIHINGGANLFDIASLTKGLNHLLFLKLFSEGVFNPTDRFDQYLSVPNVGDRQLWNFLSYVVQGYAFDYEALKAGKGSFKDELLQTGFHYWGQSFKYDNISSAYLALLLEKHFGTGIQEIFSEHFGEDLLFHPVTRQQIDPLLCVPTQTNLQFRGRVHDPLSRAHESDNIAVAGVFATAETVCRVFHSQVRSLVAGGYYNFASRNWLADNGITGNNYALGFDLPFSESIQGLNVTNPLLFAGWTGCRVFFSPEITICFLTNRVFCGDSVELRQGFSRFSWRVIREICKQAL